METEAQENNARRVAIVTGGSRGIGRAIAVALGEKNFNVIVNYAGNQQAAREVCEQIGPHARAVQGDISIADDRRRLLAETIEAFGAIDLLVNNAGIAPAKRADILDIASADEASFDRLINVNLKGPYFLTQLVANEMIRAASKGSPRESPAAGSGQGESAAGQMISSHRRVAEMSTGKIITITSVSAYTASVNRGDYCIAKAGLSMMTKLFAARMAEFGVNVYEIRPGVIATDMTGPVKAKYDELIFEKDLTPIHRWGQPQDVARAVVAIAEDQFPFSTGQVIDVDGGFHLRRL